MNIISTEDNKLLENVPDLTSWEEAYRWVKNGQQLAAQLTPKQISEAETAHLEWSDIEQIRGPIFGLYSSKQWRQFVLATFLADLISYSVPVDQVTFERLLFVMHAFPQGFRTWWIKTPKLPWIPAGYTGWYPMLENAFELFEKHPEKLKDRMVVPTTYPRGKNPYLYLFNYSAAPILKHTPFTKALMKSFVLDLSAQQPKGLASICVSDDGVRIAERFGMSCSGHIDMDGTSEGVFTRRF